MKSLFILFILTMLIISCSEGKSDILSSEERAWLESHRGEVSVLFGPENPPENFTNEMGVYTGMLVDYSRELQEILGFDFNRKVFSSWAGMMDYAEGEDHFVIIGVAPSERRSRFLRFGSKLVDVRYVLVTREGAEIGSSAELTGKTIYAIDGYSIFDERDRVLPGVNLKPVDHVLEGLQAVAGGEVDGMVDVSTYIDYNITHENLKGLEIHDVIDYDVDYHIGVSLDDERLAGIMEKALDQIPPARHKELSAVWRSMNMNRIVPRLWKILFSSVGILILLIAFVLLWVFSLKREVLRQTEIILKDEQKRMEADRSDSLKVLAGGISHDLNNLLTGLYAYTELACNALERGENARSYLEQVLKTLDDSRNLSGQLLSFSKDGAEGRDKKAFSPAAYIREMVAFSLHGSRTKIDVDVPDGLWPIVADKGRIGQVVSNLVINAVQAMDGEGQLRIRGRNRMEKGEALVELSIRDDGPGIPVELQGRVFDPYFTTKDRGSGLGLASCRAIMADHGGSLFLRSRPGEGAEFILRLPAVPGPGVPE
jgi:signal transduction histidine kinase